MSEHLLAELEGIARDPEKDALEKISQEVGSLKENQSKFAALISQYIKSNDRKMEAIENSIEILQNKGANINVDNKSEGGSGGDATGGSISDLDVN